jgi:hypothetical protein
MWAREQESGRADIRSERSQGRRSERSRGNMPVACLSEKASSLRRSGASRYLSICRRRITGYELQAGFSRTFETLPN